MLKITNVCKSYDNNQVLKDTCITVDNEIRILLGVNGCGKSTLLKVVTGILQADSGEVFSDDTNLLVLPPEKRKIGYVPQHTSLFNSMSVYENVIYGLRKKKLTPEQKETADMFIEMLEIEDILDKKPTELSGGYKSRVSLARALVPQPNVMLLDEPLSDVDIVMKERLLPKFKEAIHALNIPALYVTHDPSEACAVGDTFSAMISGVITKKESADDAFSYVKQEEIDLIEKKFS